MPGPQCRTMSGYRRHAARVRHGPGADPGTADVISVAIPISWQVGTAACCYVFIERLRRVARLGIAIRTVRSYLDRIRAKWAAAAEPVQDVRSLAHEYPPHPDPGGGR
jgi:hypothetical protein